MTTQRIKTEEDVHRLLLVVAEYARFNMNANLTVVQILDGVKDIAKESDEVTE